MLMPSTHLYGRQDLPPPCTRRKKFVGGENFPSRFIADGTESVERRLGTGIGVDHCGSGGIDGARLPVVSVSGRISIWS